MILGHLEDIFENDFSSFDRVCIAVGLISEGKAKEIDKFSKNMMLTSA